MFNEELASTIDALFNPEPDKDGVYPREFPDKRITDFHKLDASYMNAFLWEGASTHQYTRKCNAHENEIHSLTKNSDVPRRLFESGLRLFADSIVEYHAQSERKGRIRYFPAVIMTFWSGFETYVRYSSELMLVTTKAVPDVVKNFLTEKESFLEKGEQRSRIKYQPVLERYAALLRYGYNFKADRGSSFWQSLERAKDLRDYYTHLDVSELPRAIKSTQVSEFLESVLMGLIWPSCELRRTLLLGIYDLYYIWVNLNELQNEFVEQPFFTDFSFEEGYLFHCNFENVDTSRFPNMPEKLRLDEMNCRGRTKSSD